VLLDTTRFEKLTGTTLPDWRASLDAVAWRTDGLAEDLVRGDLDLRHELRA
jgi:hypothetical protein